jgi:hypothetical protein
MKKEETGKGIQDSGHAASLTRRPDSTDVF